MKPSKITESVVNVIKIELKPNTNFTMFKTSNDRKKNIFFSYIMIAAFIKLKYLTSTESNSNTKRIKICLKNRTPT